MPRLSWLTVALFAHLAIGQTIQVSKDNRTIAITTTDDAIAAADSAQVSVGFVTYGRDADSTYAEGSRLSNAILAAVRSSGVTEAQIASRSQNLQPLGEEDKLRFGSGLRFQLNQSWQVSVPATSAASLLQVAINAGANQSGDIQWSLKKHDQLQAEAAAKALAHAHDIAEHMANGLHASLGALIYASNQAPSRFPSGMVLNAESAQVSRTVSKAAPLAIVPDKVTESATVYAVFAIE